MALAIDSGPTSGVAGSGTPHNVTFNNAAGTILFGLVGFGGGSTDTINSETYNSLSLTEITAGAVTGGVAKQQAKIYVRSSPSTGSNTLATSYSSAGAEENETAISFTGQDGATPYTTLTPVTGSAVTSIALDFSGMAAGDIGVGVAAIGNDAGAALTSPSISGGATLNSSYSAAFNGTTFWSFKVTTPGTVTLSWTGSFNAAMVGAIVKQAATATAGQNIGNARIASRFVGPAVQRFLFRPPPVGLMGGAIAPDTSPAVMPRAAGNRLVGPPALRNKLRATWLPATGASGPNNFSQALTATLDFVGALVKSTAHTGEAGALSFAGALVKRTSTARTATLSFAGSLARSIGKALTGALSFAGARVVRIAKGLTGALSFAGSVTRAITLAAKTATLSFAGALVKSTSTARTATLSFAGSVLTGKAFLRAFTATLSFSGAFAKLPNKALAGTLSFAGSQSRAIVHTMSAALSFAGSQTRRITLAAKTATLNFAGSLVAGHLFTKALTATLSFAGAASRRAGKALTGSLSFVGARGPTRIGKALSTTLGSSGVLARVSSAVQAVYGWGARGRVGGAAASDPFQRLGSESARDPWQRIGSESADDPFQRIGSESADADTGAIGGESAQGTPGKIGSDEA